VLLEMPDDPCTVTFTLPLIEAAMLGRAGVDTIREVGLTTAGGMLTEKPDIEEKLTTLLESNPEPVMVSKLSGAAEVLERVMVGAELDTTAGVTVSITAELVTPLADAVICDVPAASPVAIPVLPIVDTFVALLFHEKVVPAMEFPVRSFAVAVNC
jgi:hypothetical protein